MFSKFYFSSFKTVDNFFLHNQRIHAWGKDLKEAFEQCAMGVFGYITDLKTVSIEKYADVEASGGDDECSMLFRFLDDVLFLFNAEPFLIPKVN